MGPPPPVNAVPPRDFPEGKTLPTAPRLDVSDAAGQKDKGDNVLDAVRTQVELFLRAQGVDINGERVSAAIAQNVTPVGVMLRLWSVLKQDHNGCIPSLDWLIDFFRQELASAQPLPYLNAVDSLLRLRPSQFENATAINQKLRDLRRVLPDLPEKFWMHMNIALLPKEVRQFVETQPNPSGVGAVEWDEKALPAFKVVISTNSARYWPPRPSTAASGAGPSGSNGKRAAPASPAPVAKKAAAAAKGDAPRGSKAIALATPVSQRSAVPKPGHALFLQDFVPGRRERRECLLCGAPNHKVEACPEREEAYRKGRLFWYPPKN